MSISIVNSAIRIAEELGVTNLDVIPPTMWGKLWSNLSQLKANHQWTEEEWEAAMDHFCYPDDKPWPFKDDRLSNLQCYSLLLKHIEDLYQSI